MLLSSLSLLRRALFSDASFESSALHEASARVECIVRRHLDAVWRTARDLGVPPRDVDDVVQEVMLVVVRRLDDIEPERERAFVLGATARIAANWRRRRRRHPEDLTDSLDSVSGVYEVAAGRGAFPGPEQACERSEKLELLSRALEQMPAPLRVAFTLFELEELTAKEIADQLGVPPSAVFSRVRRAWVVFRQCCEQANVELRADGQEHEHD
ncbi:MAG: sigma-70 family RNA polymerase sigma factor [Deltaproteobacteria bacterium]